MNGNDQNMKEVFGNSIIRDAVPQAGDTFIIVNRADNRVLALLDGKLHLASDTSHAGNCYWFCVEKDGWLGFRETELGRYLGHDFWFNFTAEATHHEEYEYFQPRRLAGGGYLLLAPNLGRLLQVAIGKDGDSLTAASKDGAAWEFINV